MPLQGSNGLSYGRAKVALIIESIFDGAFP